MQQLPAALHLLLQCTTDSLALGLCFKGITQPQGSLLPV